MGADRFREDLRRSRCARGLWQARKKERATKESMRGEYTSPKTAAPVLWHARMFEPILSYNLIDFILFSLKLYTTKVYIVKDFDCKITILQLDRMTNF